MEVKQCLKYVRFTEVYETTDGYCKTQEAAFKSNRGHETACSSLLEFTDFLNLGILQKKSMSWYSTSRKQSLTIRMHDKNLAHAMWENACINSSMLKDYFTRKASIIAIHVSQGGVSSKASPFQPYSKITSRKVIRYVGLHE